LSGPPRSVGSPRPRISLGQVASWWFSSRLNLRNIAAGRGLHWPLACEHLFVVLAFCRLDFVVVDAVFCAGAPRQKVKHQKFARISPRRTRAVRRIGPPPASSGGSRAATGCSLEPRKTSTSRWAGRDLSSSFQRRAPARLAPFRRHPTFRRARSFGVNQTPPGERRKKPYFHLGRTGGDLNRRRPIAFSVAPRTLNTQRRPMPTAGATSRLNAIALRIRGQVGHRPRSALGRPAPAKILPTRVPPPACPTIACACRRAFFQLAARPSIFFARTPETARAVPEQWRATFRRALAPPTRVGPSGKNGAR